MENNCQDKAHDYEPCDSSFAENTRTVNGLLIPNNELQNFKELYRGYDYKLNRYDEEHHFAYDFVSLKEKQANILTQELAKINAVNPIYLQPVYSQKSKHQKTTVQKQNDCEKRRSKNKAARKAKKRK